MAGEYPAVEVDARRRVEALGPAELARRRVELERALAEAGAPSPAGRRLEALDERIVAARAHVDALADERARASDPEGARRAETLERQARTQLGRLEDDRVEVARRAEAEPSPRAREAQARFDLRLVEERTVELRRQHVASERAVPSEIVHRALGPYPEDAHQALAWDEGADLIHGFRVRHGITSDGGDPLGPRSGDAKRRRERQAAEERLERIRLRLRHERARTTERALQIEMI